MKSLIKKIVFLIYGFIFCVNFIHADGYYKVGKLRDHGGILWEGEVVEVEIPAGKILDLTENITLIADRLILNGAIRTNGYELNLLVKEIEWGNQFSLNKDKTYKSKKPDFHKAYGAIFDTKGLGDRKSKMSIEQIDRTEFSKQDYLKGVITAFAATKPKNRGIMDPPAVPPAWPDPPRASFSSGIDCKGLKGRNGIHGKKGLPGFHGMGAECKDDNKGTCFESEAKKEMPGAINVFTINQESQSGYPVIDGQGQQGGDGGAGQPGGKGGKGRNGQQAYLKCDPVGSTISKVIDPVISEILDEEPLGGIFTNEAVYCAEYNSGNGGNGGFGGYGGASGAPGNGGAPVSLSFFLASPNPEVDYELSSQKKEKVLKGEFLSYPGTGGFLSPVAPSGEVGEPGAGGPKVSDSIVKSFHFFKCKGLFNCGWRRYEITLCDKTIWGGKSGRKVEKPEKPPEGMKITSDNDYFKSRQRMRNVDLYNCNKTDIECKKVVGKTYGDGKSKLEPNVQSLAEITEYRDRLEYEWLAYHNFRLAYYNFYSSILLASQHRVATLENVTKLYNGEIKMADLEFKDERRLKKIRQNWERNYRKNRKMLENKRLTGVQDTRYRNFSGFSKRIIRELNTYLETRNEEKFFIETRTATRRNIKRRIGNLADSCTTYHKKLDTENINWPNDEFKKVFLVSECQFIEELIESPFEDIRLKAEITGTNMADLESDSIKVLNKNSSETGFIFKLKKQWDRVAHKIKRQFTIVPTALAEEEEPSQVEVVLLGAASKYPLNAVNIRKSYRPSSKKLHRKKGMVTGFRVPKKMKINRLNYHLDETVYLPLIKFK